MPEGLSIEEVYKLKSVTFPFTMRNASGYVDIANYTEIVEGRSSENGGVYFDLSHVPNAQLEEEASIPFRYFLEHGVDIRRQPLEIAPSIQHMNGGILINEKAETSLPGLYAAGEAAGGQHGADRPGGNSLADCQVFGARAGRYATERAVKRTIRPSLKYVRKAEDEISKLMRLEGQMDVEDIAGSIRDIMWRNVSVVRNERSLCETYHSLLRYKEKASSDLLVDEDHLIEALELRNIIDVGLIITLAALTRKETRGSHYRTDYPERNDRDWLKMIEIQRGDVEPQVGIRSPFMLISP